MPRRTKTNEELADFGEACSIANDDCTAPAGWRTGSGIVENTSLVNFQLPICGVCGQPVCKACSKIKNKIRICYDCAEHTT